MATEARSVVRVAEEDQGEMAPHTSIVAGGIFCICFALFHLAFWKLFRWETELAKLTSLNRAVVQVLNLEKPGKFEVSKAEAILDTL